MTADRDGEADSVAVDDAVEILLRFGAAMLQAGNTAFRVREWMGVMACRMGFNALSVSLSLGSVTASVRRGDERTTMMREIGPPSVNAYDIGALERLAQMVEPGQAPREIAAKLKEIETAPPRYSTAQTAAAIGAACGAFAYLSGGGIVEVIAAAIGGGAGQRLRALLFDRRLNQYGVTALCALAASAVYALVMTAASHSGFGAARHSAGLISSVLFLVPGFPLVAALLDLLQYQTVAALTRFAYGAMILLAAAFGLSIVIALAGFDMAPQQPPALAFSLTLLLRAIASFTGGCGFAMLYNTSTRAVLVVGLLALGANELRLALHDAGLMLAPATFLGALAVGLVASLTHRHLYEPRIAVTVPAIIIMVPGLYALQTIVLFNQGNIIEALQAAGLCGFVIGAMAMGLTTARFLSREIAESRKVKAGQSLLEKH